MRTCAAIACCGIAFRDDAVERGVPAAQQIVDDGTVDRLLAETIVGHADLGRRGDLGDMRADSEFGIHVFATCHGAALGPLPGGMPVSRARLPPSRGLRKARHSGRIATMKDLTLRSDRQ